jgi:hypothetical protein
MTDGAPRFLSSRLLPGVFEAIGEVPRLTVLDAGSALPESVDFFSQSRCRLCFADIFEEVAGEAEEMRDEGVWLALFNRVFDYPADTRFDLCLFWDVFNYLDDIALRALATALRPFLHDKTMAHGFAVLNRRTRVPSAQYGVLARDQISVRPRPLPAVARFPRSQANLESVFPIFNARRSVLHGDGLLEVSLGVS